MAKPIRNLLDGTMCKMIVIRWVQHPLLPWRVARAIGIDLPKLGLDLGVDKLGGILGAAVVNKLIPLIPNQFGLRQ